MESFACLLAVGVSYNNICSIDPDSGAFRQLLLSEPIKDAWQLLSLVIVSAKLTNILIDAVTLEQFSLLCFRFYNLFLVTLWQQGRGSEGKKAWFKC
jgi:hypothetical protein